MKKPADRGDGIQPARENLFAPKGEPEVTGRYIVVFREEAAGKATSLLKKRAGLQLASSADFEKGAVDPERLSGADGIVFERLGVGVVSSVPAQMQALVAEPEAESPILAIEPERILYAIAEDSLVLEDGAAPALLGPPPVFEAWQGLSEAPPQAVLTPSLAAYLRGYRAAVDHLVGSLLGEEGWQAAALEEVEAAVDESQATWGLQATRVLRSAFNGQGVRVAVLDTGLDLNHPDFAGRAIVSRSFVTGQPVQDGHGHGTHCIGSALGPARPAVLPRYGVASGAEIFAGKVLSDQGSGADGGILAGINWAVENDCRIVSMSLGAPVRRGDPPSAVYETVARRALSQGTVIIAAAGNDSDRRAGQIEPVSRPANSPSILAVGAVDVAMQMAFFSNGGINPNGGEVNIAGPGVDIHSTVPMPRRYARFNGTSMATPHVAGIAALFAEANPRASARTLWRTIVRNARAVPHPRRDVGSGLVQAP